MVVWNARYWRCKGEQPRSAPPPQVMLDRVHVERECPYLGAGPLFPGCPWLRSARALISRFSACLRDSWKDSITSPGGPSSGAVTEANEAELLQRAANPVSRTPIGKHVPGIQPI
jgi:hypothetical protein